MLSLFSQDQPETVRTSTSSLWPAIRNALLGLPFAGGGLFMAGQGISILLSEPVGSVILFALSALCGGVGGYTFRNAYKWFRLWQVYGTSRLHLETAPVPLGETLRARIRVPIAADEQPPSDFQVRVAATQGKGGDKEMMWEDETSASGQPGPGETEVPLSLDLPAHPYGDWLDWTLEVTAWFDDTDSRIGKPDYTASYLPVSLPDNLEERAAVDSSADGSISSKSTRQEAETAAAPDEDEVYWTVDDDGEETNLRRTDSETNPSHDA